MPDLADEPESLAGDGADQALFLAIVADRLADRIDMTGQRRLGNDPSVPYRIEQIVLADDVLAVLDQMDEQVEDLRPDGDGLAIPG